jgi:hypothetical protein
MTAFPSGSLPHALHSNCVLPEPLGESKDKLDRREEKKRNESERERNEREMHTHWCPFLGQQLNKVLIGRSGERVSE